MFRLMLGRTQTMARRKEGLSSTDICALLLFISQVALQASTKVDEYKESDISKQWSQAREACDKESKILAQIDNIDLFNSTKEKLYKASSGQGKKYWTGLRYKDKLLWSDGKLTFCNGSLSAILNCTHVKNLINESCFIIQENFDKLRAKRCDIAERYICQYVPLTAPPTTSTNSKKSTSSNLQTSHPTEAGNNNRGGLIDSYLKLIRYLNETNPSSLQQAINATDELLNNFKASKENTSILFAAQALEVFVKSFAKRQLTAANDTFMQSGKELVIIMKMVQSNSEDLVVSGSSRSHSDRLQESDVHIRLPASMFHEKGGYMAAIVYSKLHKLLPSEAQTFLDGIPTESGYIGSRIFAIAVEPLKYPLQGRALFDFGHLKPTLRSSKPECVFWNFSMMGGSNDSSGSWSRRGCKTENYTSRRTYCSCDHLTHFAVLMQLKDHEIPVKHRMALELITYIGCAFSLMGEFITIVAYVVFLNLKAGDTQIRLNFVISIAVAQLIFIFGIDTTQTKAICTTIAAAIHYFFLVSFCWMLIEGLTLYYKMVKVFDTDFKMWPFCAFSWGFPLALVSISLLTAAASEGGIASYVADSFCWLSFSNGFVWFFVAPVLIISILNVFVLARVTRELFTMDPTKVSSESNKFKRVLRACVVLFPLLGVTWVFGVLSATDPTGIVFQYLFTICNSLQGFFIFLLHVVRSSEFRATVKRKLRRWGSKRNPTVVPGLILPTNNNKNDSYDMRRDSLACVRK